MSFDFSSFQMKADQALNHISNDVATLRTGKASAQLLDPVVVDAYGSKLKIQELAQVSVPDPTLLVIKPWDSGVLEDIEKAISMAGLNLNPVVDGDIIRIAIPPLTEERRQEMVKLLHQKIESGRVMLRSIRTDIKKDIEAQKGQGGVSEDDVKLDLKQLEDEMKTYFDRLDELAQKKEQELLTV